MKVITKEKALTMNLQELKDLDTIAFNYWQMLRKIAEFRQLED